MKAWRYFLTMLIPLVLLQSGRAQTQMCGNWSTPLAVSDSVSDNTNPFIAGAYSDFKVFWERLTEDSVSQIVYMDYYIPGTPEVVVAGNGFTVSDPRVIMTGGWWPYSDTSAFVFYRSDQAGHADIYYKVMLASGVFSDPLPFATDALDEFHLNVSQGGGIVWQEGEKVRFTRLRREQSGFFFDPVITIDSGQCRKPDIVNTSEYMPEDYIVWEKGGPDSPEIRYSQWSWGLGQWGPPVTLFTDGRHFNPELAATMYYMPLPQLVCEYIDDSEHYFSVYDFYGQEEFISEISQSESFQPNLFSMDIPITEFGAIGFMSFRYGENAGSSDIFCNDFGEFTPWIENYCCIDSNSYPERHPQLFQGAEGGDCFDLILVWEAFRNGHWQLYTSTTLVVIGEVHEQQRSPSIAVETYPNPCREEMRVGFRLNGPSNVTVSIINNMGELLITRELNDIPPGFHEEIFSLAEFPSGAYHIHVQAGRSTGSKVVIKQ